jgi:hypothetical protein
MAEVKESMATLWTEPSQTSSQDLASHYGLSSRDEFAESMQKSGSVALSSLPLPPPYPPPIPSTATSAIVPPPPPPSTKPLVTTLLQPNFAQQEQVRVLRDGSSEEVSPKSSRRSTQSSPRRSSAEVQIFIEQTPTEPQTRGFTPSEKKRSDIKKADADINGQLLKTSVSVSDDGTLPPVVMASYLPHIAPMPEQSAIRNVIEQITQPPQPSVHSSRVAPSRFIQNDELVHSIPPSSHISAGPEVRKALNPPIPRSVLKKKGGQIFKRQRPTERQTVEITAVDLLQPHLTLPESTPAPPAKKRVTFSEPGPEKPSIAPEPHRLTARQRKQLNDANIARRQANIFRNEAEIERRFFSSSRSLLNEHLEDLLHLGPALMSKLSEDGPQKSGENLVHDFEKKWTKIRDTINLILKQHSTFERVVQKLTDTENSLISLDNRMREKDELRLNRAALVSSGGDDDDEDDEALSDRSSDSPASAHSDSSGQTPSLVREYYDKIGEVLLTKDYIHNLETEHLQTVRARKSQRDLGIEPDISDAQIYQEYFNERHELLAYYIGSKEAVRILWGLCRDNEYVVEAPNLPPEDPDMDQSIRPSNTIRVLLNLDHVPSEGTNTIASILAPDLHEPVRPSRSRVMKWLKQVETDLRPDNGWGIDTDYSLAGNTLDDTPSVPPGSVGIFDLDEVERTQTDQSSKSEKDAAKFQPDKIIHRYSDPNLRSKPFDEFAKVRRRLKIRRAFSETL